MSAKATLDLISRAFSLDLSARSPIEIPNANRETLARMFHVCSFSAGAEIGVEQGEYSEVLCQAIPGVRLLCVDAWRAYPGYRDHVDQRKLDRFFEETTARLAPYSGATLVRKFSLDAVTDVPDGSLDFVYIDGNHSFQACTNDIAEWSKKVRPGGIIAGHDYVRYYLPNQIQVVQVVNGWTDAQEITPWFLLGRQEKREGELRDTARSWFWVHDPKPRHRGRRPLKQ